MKLAPRALDAARSSRGFVRKALLLVLLALIVVAVLVQSGAGSLSKEDVRRDILAIQKNAPFAAAMRTAPLPGVPVGNMDSPAMGAYFPATGDELPPIVLVHGTPDTMGAFGALLFGEGGLHGQANVWALEVAGHGFALANEDEYSFQICADHVAASLQAFGLEGVTLVGNSYGGEFCWRVAADHPELVARLVLIDSSGLPRTDDQFLSEEVKMREWSVARLGYLLNSEERVAFALDPHFDGHADPGRVHEVFLGLENRANWNAMIDLVRDENGARENDLARIQAPTLLLWGETDQAYPPDTFGRVFDERIPSSRLVVVEGAGHYPHEQQPALVAKEILALHREGRGK
ncbi:Lipase 3 precursor [Planctomycetes bacterium Poly30]|uniref:Lipase 3 n=1 Tax=Saltatorellus ferox TaxID=2528018 RepID=A0A518EVB8_9BACT|nr:Lipase 3 precursor [Planctomycetes bacterium Poly30]